MGTDSGEGKRPRLGNEWNPDWAASPAGTLNDWFAYLGLSASEVAARCSDPADAKLAIRVVLERKPLTPQHADLLAEMTPTPAHLWLRLERIYREDLAAGRKDREPPPFPLPGEERRA